MKSNKYIIKNKFYGISNRINLIWLKITLKIYLKHVWKAAAPRRTLGRPTIASLLQLQHAKVLPCSSSSF